MSEADPLRPRDLVRLIAARELARAESNALGERWRAQRDQTAGREGADETGARGDSGPDLAGELGRAQRRLEMAWQAVEVAFGTAARSAPPLSLIRMTDRALTLARSSTGGPNDERQTITTQLEAIVDFTVHTWLPGVDLRAVLEALEHDGHGGLPPPPPLPTDPSWGYPPVDAQTLSARVGHALGRSSLTALKRELASKLDGRPTVAKEGFLDRLSNVLDLEGIGVRAPDPDGLIRAFENNRYAMMEGLGVYPPLRVWLAATCAAGIVRALYMLEEGIDPKTGAVVQSLHPVHCAVVMRAVSALAHTVDEVFPAFAEVGAALRSGPSRGRGDVGPYRAAAARTTPDDPLASDPRAQIALALSSVGAIAPLDLAIAHGAMIYDLDAAIAALRARPFAEKLGSWGKGASRDELAPVTRRSWHTELVQRLCYESWRLTSQLRDRIPTLTLRDAIFAVSANARGIAIVREGETSRHLAVVAVTHTLQAIDGVASILRGLVGGAFDRVTLMSEVARVIATGHATQGEHPWVTRLAAELAPTPFAAHFARLTEHQQAFERASAVHAAAESAMSFWDRLVPDSALEAANRAAQAELEALPEALHGDWREACRHFDRAVGVIPVAALGLGLYEAREAMRRVRFVSESVRASASLSPLVRTVVFTTSGLDEATLAMQRWTRHAIVMLGPMPSNGELLFHAVTHLAARLAL